MKEGIIMRSFDLLKLIIILILVNYKIYSKKSINRFIFIFISMFTVRVLGSDYIAYKNLYYLVLERYTHIEPLIKMIMIVLRKQNLSHNFFFFIMLVVPTFFFQKMIKKYQYKNFGFLMLLLLYFFRGYMDAMRQLLSVTLLYYSIYLSFNKKKFKSLFLKIFSISSHYSSGIIFFIKKTSKKMTKKSYILNIVVLILASKVGILLFNFIIIKFQLQNQIINKYLMYQTYDIKYEYINQTQKILLFFVNNIPEILTVIINFILLNKKIKFDEFHNFLLKMSITGSTLYFILLSLNMRTLGSRIDFTLSFGQIFLLTKCIENKNINKKEIKIILMISYLSIIISSLYKVGIYNYL